MRAHAHTYHTLARTFPFVCAELFVFPQQDVITSLPDMEPSYRRSLTVRFHSFADMYHSSCACVSLRACVCVLSCAGWGRIRVNETSFSMNPLLPGNATEIKYKKVSTSYILFYLFSIIIIINIAIMTISTMCLRFSCRFGTRG